MINKHKTFIASIISAIILLTISCEWPFNTTSTENDVFELTVNHNIIKLMTSAEINLEWNEITVENFAMYKIERMRTQDTLWTSITELSDAFQLSYVDTIMDDDNLIYRVGIIDLDDNVLWATEPISIPKTTSILVPLEFETIQPAFDSELIDDGDTVLVNVGTYEETLSIAGKDVLIISTGNYNDGMRRIAGKNVLAGLTERYKETILMPTYADPPNERVINISSGIVDGFTIKEGVPSYGDPGGGVAIAQNGTVQNCYITGNLSANGGGVFLTDSGNLYNNIIYNNTGGTGTGIYITSANGEIINNTIVQNDIVINGDCTGLLIRNNILYQSQPDIAYTNSALQTGIIIDFNRLDENIQIGSDYINENPGFLDNINFILSSSSLCIDAGHDGTQYLDNDGSRNDLGAYGGPSANL